MLTIDLILYCFRLNSDELRTLKSKTMVYQVAASRATQLTEKQTAKLKEAEDRATSDAAWEAQRLLRVAKDEAEQMRRRANDVNRMQALEQQIREVAIVREKEAELVKNEAALMMAAAEVQRVKDEHAARVKEEQHRLIRADLDKVNSSRAKARLEAAKLALEQDRAWLAALEQADNVDRAAAAERKRALRNELIEFREHVDAQRAALVTRNQALDRSYRADEERMWRAKVAKWDAEQKARDLLMDEVIRSREAQLEAKLEQVRKEMEVHRVEREQLEKLLQREKAAVAAERKHHRDTQKTYHHELQAQIGDKLVRAAKHIEKERKVETDRKLREEQEQTWLMNELKQEMSMIGSTNGKVQV
jgi:hypothetical protein